MQTANPGTLEPVPQNLVDPVKRMGDSPANCYEVGDKCKSQSESGFGAEVERADAPDVLSFLGLGDRFYKGDGQCKTCGPETLNRTFFNLQGNVDKPRAGIVVRSAEDDETPVRGPNVFGGYQTGPGTTREGLSADSCSHTGDLGRVDEEYYLHITGRKFVAASVAEISPHLLRVNRANEFRILKYSLSGDADELTPTLTLKRRVIEKNNAALTKAICAQPCEKEKT